MIRTRQHVNLGRNPRSLAKTRLPRLVTTPQVTISEAATQGYSTVAPPIAFNHSGAPSIQHATVNNNTFVMVWFYIALYPVRWTAQSALHFPPLADLFIPTPFSASLGSILAMQQLRNDYSLTFPPLSIARYSFIQLSRLRRREVKENAQTSKR